MVELTSFRSKGDARRAGESSRGRASISRRLARQGSSAWERTAQRHRESVRPRPGSRRPRGSTAQLRRAYVLAAACDRLALVVGRPLVEMLAGSLAILTHRGVSALQSVSSGLYGEVPDGEDPPRTAVEMASAMSLFLMGSASPIAPGVLRLFWEDPADPGWRLAAQATGMDWHAYIGLQDCSQQLGRDSRALRRHGACHE